MNPQLTVSHMAERANHERLQTQAERAWLAEEAKANQAMHRSVGASIRRSLGAALVWAGTRIHGRPRLTIADRPIAATPADGAVG